MNKTIIKKATALMLAFILTFANVLLLGIYTQESIALTEVELEEQDANVSNANMTFDAYFLKGEEGLETKTHSKDVDIGTNSDTLYAQIKVTDGYLAGGTINLTNSNIRFVQTEDLPASVQSIEENIVTLNRIESGETVILALPIKLDTASNFDVQNIDRESDVVLQGNYFNTLGIEREISKTMKVKASMTAQAEANLETEITKYLNQTINGQKITIFQFIIKSNLVNNILPVEKTELEIEIPEINEIAPETVSVSAFSGATNGLGRRIYTNDEYTYENGKIGLIITNEEINGKVSWIKDVQDEIMITCVYGETVTALEDIEITVNSKITPYGNSSIIIGNIDVTDDHEELDGIEYNDPISYQLFEPAKIQKGYMLVEGADNTPYNESIEINIGSRNIVDKITLNETTKYVDGNNNEFLSNPIYKSTSVREEDLVGILGEDGYINIYGQDNNLITSLNKDNLTYEYENEVSLITIETSKPQTEGIIYIYNKKEIKSLEYSKAQLARFTKMKMTLDGKVSLNGSNVASLGFVENNFVELDNPEEQASFELSVDSFSTVTYNEGVEFRTILKTTDASAVLFKNPIIEYVLPKDIILISIKKASLLYDDNIHIEDIEIEENNDGNIVIRIITHGEQTEFNKDALVEGATIAVEADIVVNELTPTKADNIIMNVINEATNNKITENVPISLIAPVGMATANQISEYNDDEEILTAISGRSETGILNIESTARVAEIKNYIINNNEEDSENIVILGRIPFEGNKDIIEGSELGSNFTANIIGDIKAKTEGLEDYFTVYYSTNGEATKDLGNSANGWAEFLDDITSIKSYMIVMNNYTLASGDTICFSYNVMIPENLTFNMSAYEMFAVYYNKVGRPQVTETSRSAVAGFSTGIESGLADDGFNYNEEEQNDSEIIMNISNVWSDEYRGGDEAQFLLYVGQQSQMQLHDIVVTCELPEGLVFEETGCDGTYDEESRIITWTFDTIEEMQFFALTCSIENLPDTVYSKQIPIVLKATCNETAVEYSSNVYVISVIRDGFTVSQTSNIVDGKIVAGDEITYAITIKNLSNNNSSITITDHFPSGFEFVKFQYSRNGQITKRERNEGTAVQIPITFNGGETITVYLTLKVDDYLEVNDIIRNRVVLNSVEIKDLESIFINYKYDASGSQNNNVDDNNNDSELPGDNDGENKDFSTYMLSGIVWLDSDKNGQRDAGEGIKEGIEVLLLDNQTNKIIQRTQTDEKGMYIFENVSVAQYIVAFKYNTKEYVITTYQAENVNESVNSDAISMEIKVDGKIGTYAVTDTLNVSSNMYNVDLGLIINKKFDMELTKSISLIQTSNSKGTQTYTFDKMKVAKIEIPGNEIVGTLVAITYNFTIENKGDISGYVNKIVDYMPADMTFTSSLNPEWYQDTDGNLFNVSLANRLIKPGEKVELSLILNKTMTEENTGVVNNSAEIYETSNDFNIYDIDSISGNKKISEDDFGSADAIITVKTGQTVMYIGLVLFIIALFGTGLYMIKKKVLEV